jgi:hypothetical protein
MRRSFVIRCERFGSAWTGLKSSAAPVTPRAARGLTGALGCVIAGTGVLGMIAGELVATAPLAV